MRKYVLIGCGGFLGAVLRFAVKNMAFGPFGGAVPLGTLAVNIAGAFLLAFVLAAEPAKREWAADLQLGVTAGLLGALTTFSTLCRETAGLITGGDYIPALLYVAVSAALGFGAAHLGYISRLRYESLRAARIFGNEADGAAEPEVPEGEAE